MDSDQNQLMPSSTNEGFVFDIKVETASELFNQGPLSELVPNFGEMIIESEWFERHQDCQDDVARLLTSIAHIMRTETEKKFAIATKINPCHDIDYIAADDPDPWNPTIVMRMYLCDYDLLKNEMIVDSHITATIWAAPKVHLAAQPPTLIAQ